MQARHRLVAGLLASGVLLVVLVAGTRAPVDLPVEPGPVASAAPAPPAAADLPEVVAAVSAVGPLGRRVVDGPVGTPADPDGPSTTGRGCGALREDGPAGPVLGWQVDGTVASLVLVREDGAGERLPLRSWLPAATAALLEDLATAPGATEVVERVRRSDLVVDVRVVRVPVPAGELVLSDLGGGDGYRWAELRRPDAAACALGPAAARVVGDGSGPVATADGWGDLVVGARLDDLRAAGLLGTAAAPAEGGELDAACRSVPLDDVPGLRSLLVQDGRVRAVGLSSGSVASPAGGRLAVGAPVGAVRASFPDRVGPGELRALRDNSGVVVPLGGDRRVVVSVARPSAVVARRRRPGPGARGPRGLAPRRPGLRPCRVTCPPRRGGRPVRRWGVPRPRTSRLLAAAACLGAVVLGAVLARPGTAADEDQVAAARQALAPDTERGAAHARRPAARRRPRRPRGRRRRPPARHGGRRGRRGGVLRPATGLRRVPAGAAGAVRQRTGDGRGRVARGRTDRGRHGRPPRRGRRVVPRAGPGGSPGRPAPGRRPPAGLDPRARPVAGRARGGRRGLGGAAAGGAGVLRRPRRGRHHRPRPGAHRRRGRLPGPARGRRDLRGAPRARPGRLGGRADGDDPRRAHGDRRGADRRLLRRPAALPAPARRGRAGPVYVVVAPRASSPTSSGGSPWTRGGRTRACAWGDRGPGARTTTRG